METIPYVISGKDLLYLEDIFKWNYTAYKEIEHFIDEVEDEQIKDLFENIRNMHEDNMNFVIKILKKEKVLEEDNYEE